jgi:hypothetical protein
MKRLIALGVGLFAAFAALTVMTAAVFAVQPSNLPEGVKRFTGPHEGSTVYHSAAGDVTCTVGESPGEETGNLPPSGTATITFRECKGPLNASCTGLGQSSGVILVPVDWELVFDREKNGTFTGLTVAMLFTFLEEVHFNCGTLLLVITRGEFLCLDLKPTEASTKHSYHCTGKSTTEPSEEWCMEGETNNTCVKWLTPKLEESVNEGVFKSSTLLLLARTAYEVAVTGMI